MSRRRAVLAAGGIVAGVVLAAVGWRLWESPPYVPPQGQAWHPASLAAETAYLDRYWQHRNSAEYGNFGGTDCVNFTSQALHARGWPMSGGWGHSVFLGRNAYTRTWVSSTALDHWLAAHPSWATATDSPQDVAVGDVAQFDWDDSGDRDHTGVVSRIVRRGGRVVEVDVAEHSPSALHRSVAAMLAQHGARARVHYWHLLR